MTFVPMQTADGQWTVSGLKLYYDTPQEAILAMEKKQYIETVKSIVGAELGELADTVPNLHKALFDNGYASGGADPITDEEAQNAGFRDSAEFYSAFTVLEKLNDFFAGTDVTGSDYLSTINKVRY